MSRSTQLVLAAALAATAPMATTAAAQSLESRVNGAPDGRVQFNFVARPGVCGNGRTYYSTAPGNYNGNFYSGIDGARMEPCVTGPVRVVTSGTGIRS